MFAPNVTTIFAVDGTLIMERHCSDSHESQDVAEYAMRFLNLSEVVSAIKFERETNFHYWTSGTQDSTEPSRQKVTKP